MDAWNPNVIVLLRSVSDESLKSSNPALFCQCRARRKRLRLGWPEPWGLCKSSLPDQNKAFKNGLLVGFIKEIQAGYRHLKIPARANCLEHDHSGKSIADIFLIFLFFLCRVGSSFTDDHLYFGHAKRSSTKKGPDVRSDPRSDLKSKHDSRYRCYHEYGGPTRGRTWDHPVMSRGLYQLSYRPVRDGDRLLCFTSFPCQGCPGVSL